MSYLLWIIIGISIGIILTLALVGGILINAIEKIGIGMSGWK